MSIMFDLVDEAFHQMPLPIYMGIVDPLLFPVGPRRYHRCRASLPDHRHEGIGVVTLVSKDKGANVPSYQCLPLGDVVALPSGKLEAQGVAQSVHADVDFGAEPTSATAQGLGLLAAPFLGAPAAQGWARMMVLSIIRCSISGS